MFNKYQLLLHSTKHFRPGNRSTIHTQCCQACTGAV